MERGAKKNAKQVKNGRWTCHMTNFKEKKENNFLDLMHITEFLMNVYERERDNYITNLYDFVYV